MNTDLEPILPKFAFLTSPIFAVKPSHFEAYENNAITIKWPSLMVKNGKMSILQSLIGLTPRLNLIKILVAYFGA